MSTETLAKAIALALACTGLAMALGLLNSFVQNLAARADSEMAALTGIEGSEEIEIDCPHALKIEDEILRLL